MGTYMASYDQLPALIFDLLVMLKVSLTRDRRIYL